MRAVCFAEFSQRLDHQKRSRKPYRSAPIRIAAFDLVVRFGGLVTHLTVAEYIWMLLVVLRQASNAVVGKKFVRINKPLEDLFCLVPVDDGKHVHVNALVLDSI